MSMDERKKGEHPDKDHGAPMQRGEERKGLNRLRMLK